MRVIKLANDRIGKLNGMSRVDPGLWREMFDQLRHRHASICRQWFEDLDPVDLDWGLLRIYTPNAVQQKYLQSKCLDQFNEAAQSATGALVAVRFVTGDRAQYESEVGTRQVGHGAAAQSRPSAVAAAGPRVISPCDDEDDPDFDQIVLNPDYRFENFIPGPGNQLAYAAAQAVATQPGTAYNPMFIHGGVGLGKTHLLQAICQAIMDADQHIQICYLSCDVFMNQFLVCVQKGKMNQFRHRYRHVDVLVIDDIHFLANRERTQEEFFHTFNALYQSNRQIVLSSDSPPAEIPQLEERLMSRFAWGLVAPVAKPEFETRVAIVRAKAQLRGLELSDEVVEYIASRIETNARELEGAVTTLQGHAVLQDKPITLDLAKQSLGDVVRDNGRSQVTLQRIIDTVTNYYDVKLSDLQSKRRQRSIAEPRQVCMWLARKRTRFSLEEIGGYFGGRDHTTVMHSIRTVDNRREQDSAFAQQTDVLAESITHGGGGGGGTQTMIS